MFDTTGPPREGEMPDQGRLMADLSGDLSGAGATPASADELERIIDVSAAAAVLAAERYRRIERFCAGAVAEARASETSRGMGVHTVTERGIRLELAAALRVTERTADVMLSTAHALVHDFPEALSSLERGAITQSHAEILVAGLASAPKDVAMQLVDAAVDLAENLAVGVFRRALKRLVDEACAESLAERHRVALSSRRVVVEQADDGMAWLMAYLPAVEAHAIHDRLTRIAKAITDNADQKADQKKVRTSLGDDETKDCRSRDQIRADALADLLIDGDTASLPVDARGIRPIVTVTVPALALLTGDGLATVEGVGPVPLERARELCGSATGWMRVLTHPETGIVLSVGRTRYRPPPELRRLVRWRAERCMAPGCVVPAGRCEIDHTIAWEDGGETGLGNLAPLCKGHHIVKHHTGWTVEQIPAEGASDGAAASSVARGARGTSVGGVLRWTSPAGRVYEVQPERRVPAFLPDAVVSGDSCGARRAAAPPPKAVHAAMTRGSGSDTDPPF